MSSKPDYSILFKVLGVDQRTAKERQEQGDEIVRRVELYRHDAVGFAKYYFPHYVRIEPPEWHKAVLSCFDHPERDALGRTYWSVSDDDAEAIRRLHKPMFSHLTKRADHLGAIAMSAPREQGKSTVFARILLIWMLVYGYKQYAVDIRSTDKLARKFVSDTMSEFETNTRLIRDFGPLKGSVWGADGMWSLRTGQGVVAVSRGSEVRGLVDREKRPDLIILDDIITDKDRRNPRLGEKTMDWILGDVVPLSAFSLIIMLNTIFAEYDPMAKILARIQKDDMPDWVGVRLSSMIVDGKTALWPEMFPIEKLEKIRAQIGQERFLPEYESICPSVEEVILHEEDVTFVSNRELNRDDYDYAVGIDPNAEGTDDVCLTLAGKHKTTGAIHIFDAYDKDWGTVTDMTDCMVRWWHVYHPFTYGMENVAFQNVYMKLLIEAFNLQGLYIPLVGIHADGSKKSRVRADSYYYMNGTVTVAEELKGSQFLYRLTHFPTPGLPDGAGDSQHYALKAFIGGVRKQTGAAGRRQRPSALPGLIGRYMNG